MKLPINTAIIKSPINWVKVWLMAFTAMVAFNYLIEGTNNSNPEME